MLGFPAAGSTREGSIVRYVLIDQQKTMLGEPSGGNTERARRLRVELDNAGFSTAISSNMDAWLLGHAAFVVPIAFALYRTGTDAARLAADRTTLRQMVRATKQGFKALGRSGNAEIPRNLRVLYLKLPPAFAVSYWRRVLASPRGELWFAAHSRAASEEMRALADDLLAAVHRTGQPVPDLDLLLEAGPG